MAICTAPNLPPGAPANRVMGFVFMQSARAFVAHYLGTSDVARLTALAAQPLTAPGPLAPVPATAEANYEAFSRAVFVSLQDLSSVIVRHSGAHRLVVDNTVGMPMRFGVHPAYARTNGRVFSTLLAVAVQCGAALGYTGLCTPVANARSVKFSMQQIKHFGVGQLIGRIPWSVYGRFHPAFASDALRAAPDCTPESLVFIFDPTAPAPVQSPTDTAAAAAAAAAVAASVAVADAAAHAAVDVAVRTLDATKVTTTALPDQILHLKAQAMASLRAASTDRPRSKL